MSAILGYITWNPDPEAFHIFGIPVRYYSLCWCMGLLLGYFIVQYLYKQQKIKDELFEPLFLYCFVGVLVGARLGHCLFYEPQYFLAHPLEMILPLKNDANGWHYVGYEGLASHGGVIGMLVAFWLYVRKTKLNIIRVLDNIAVAAPLTACFIRLGNLMNSEIVGKTTDVPWAFIFTKLGTEPRHPGQLYESLFYLLVFIVGIFLYRKFKSRMGTGFFFGYCLATIFTFRFFVEYIKENQEMFEDGMFFNMGQLLSVPFIIIGIYCMAGGKWCKRLAEMKMK